MTTALDIADATAQMVTWKHDEYRAYAVALVESGLHALADGRVWFSTDDVPDAAIPTGHGIAGSVCVSLRAANVIRNWWGNDDSYGVRHGRKRSTRKDRNGAKVDCYELSSMAGAEEFLRRNGVSVRPRQTEMW